MKMTISAILTAFVVLFLTPSAQAQGFLNERLTVKLGVGFDRVLDESTRPNDKDRRGSRLHTHHAFPKGIAGEYFINDDWLASARWESGRHVYSSDSLAQYQSLKGRDREFEVRLERAFRNAWFYARFDRLTVKTIFAEPRPRYGPPRTRDGQRVFPEVIGVEDYEEDKTTAYEAFGGGVTYRASGERVYCAGLSRVFGEYTRISSIDGKESSRGQEGRSTLGLNYDGAVGFQVYKLLGVEGSFHLKEYFGPDNTLEDNYTNRAKVRFYTVLRF